MDDEPIFYIIRSQNLVMNFWYPYGFLSFSLLWCNLFLFYDANKSKYWLSWGEMSRLKYVFKYIDDV